MWKKALWCFCFLIFINLVSADVIINEVMYDPLDGNEWVEIYNNGYAVNLSGWNISDNNAVDQISCCNNNCSLVINPNEYLIIADKDSTLNLNRMLCVDDNSIGNGLSNSGDKLNLSYENYSFYMEYDGSKGNNGYTLEYYNNNWYESLNLGGTPGRENEINDNVNQDFSQLEITEFLPNPEGYDDAPMPEGEWIEIYNKGNKDLDLTGLIFKDNANHKLIITNVNTETIIIKARDYLAVYTNGKFGFLNNDGLEIIKLFDLDGELIDEISYSDSREGVSWSKVDNLWRLNVPSPGKKNFKNEDNLETNLEIDTIYLGSDNKAKFGDLVRVKIKIYKGDTTKNSVKLYVEGDERISKETRVNIYDKFVEHDLILPIQLDANCKEKFKDGKYFVIVEGLDERDERKIQIGGRNSNLCEKTRCEKCEKCILQDSCELTGHLVQNSENLLKSSGVIYESRGVKAKNLSIYILNGLLILLLIILILTKNGRRQDKS